MIICVTGTTCSGKHTFGKYFVQVCAGELVDVDKIAHDLYKKGTKLSERLVAAFGNEILDDDERIDRKKLRNIVFVDENKFKTLNDIVHPALKQAVEDLLGFTQKDKPMVIVAALVKELDLRVDYLISVKCDADNKKERCVVKGIDEVLLKNILKHQKETEDFDFEVMNNGTIDDLKLQAKGVWIDIKKEVEEYGG